MNVIEYCCLYFIVLGIIIFMSGYHTVDTAWNMKSLGNGTYDVNSFGTVQSANQLYSNGLYELLLGFVMAVFAAISLGYEGIRKQKPKSEAKPNA